MLTLRTVSLQPHNQITHTMSVNSYVSPSAPGKWISFDGHWSPSTNRPHRRPQRGTKLQKTEHTSGATTRPTPRGGTEAPRVGPTLCKSIFRTSTTAWASFQVHIPFHTTMITTVPTVCMVTTQSTISSTSIRTK